MWAGAWEGSEPTSCSPRRALAPWSVWRVKSNRAKKSLPPGCCGCNKCPQSPLLVLTQESETPRSRSRFATFCCVTLGQSLDLHKLCFHLLQNGAMNSTRFVSTEALEACSTRPGRQEVLNKCSPLSFLSLPLLLWSLSKAARKRTSWDRIINDPQVLSRTCFISGNV